LKRARSFVQAPAAAQVVATMATQDQLEELGTNLCSMVASPVAMVVARIDVDEIGPSAAHSDRDRHLITGCMAGRRGNTSVVKTCLFSDGASCRFSRINVVAGVAAKSILIGDTFRQGEKRQGNSAALAASERSARCCQGRPLFPGVGFAVRSAPTRARWHRYQAISRMRSRATCSSRRAPVDK